jgi:hypothetical protein
LGVWGGGGGGGPGIASERVGLGGFAAKAKEIRRAATDAELAHWRWKFIRQVRR